MSEKVDWQALARQVGALGDDGRESGSSNMARQAIEILLGEETLRDAVDYYISLQPGRELIRHILWQIHPESAMKYCYDLYKSDADLETRTEAVELLRVVADHRALEWVGEFLDDPDSEIQSWGIGLLDQLLWSNLVEPEEAEIFLKKAECHINPNVLERAQFVRGYLNTSLEHSDT